MSSTSLNYMSSTRAVECYNIIINMVLWLIALRGTTWYIRSMTQKEPTSQEQREAVAVIPAVQAIVDDLTAKLETALLDSEDGGQTQVSPKHRAMLRKIPRAALADAVIRATLGALWGSWHDADDEGIGILPTTYRVVRVQELGRLVGQAAGRAYVRHTWPELSHGDADRKLERMRVNLAHLTVWGWLLIRALHETRRDLLELCSLTPEKQHTKDGKFRRAAFGFTLNAAAAERYGALLFHASHGRRPMLEPPKPWGSDDRGGYRYALKGTIPLVRAVPASQADPNCPPVIYDTLNALQVTAWRINPAVVAAAQADAARLSPEERQILEEAERDADHALYFVHALDFRGRVYPTGVWLTPQGPDLARALLQFADGCTIRPDDRAAIEALERYGEQLRGKADKHWRYVAYERERAEIKAQHDVGEPFVSRLPVWQDATANGLQHMACLRQDESLAPRVRLAKSEQPGDIYDDVAAELRKRLGPDAASLGFPIDRDAAKSPAMIFGYGGTRYGIRERFAEDHGSEYPARGELFSRTAEAALQHVLPRAFKLREWFQDVGEAIAKRRKPATWYVPGTGFPARQQIRKLNPDRDLTRLTFVWDDVTHVVTVPIRPATVLQTVAQQKKHKTSLAPNIIHSLDAAHLMLTVTQFRDAPVATVHDAYATWATVTDALRYRLHHTLGQLYEGGPLHPLFELACQFAEQCDTLPEPPPQFAFRLLEEIAELHILGDKDARPDLQVNILSPTFGASTLTH